MPKNKVLTPVVCKPIVKGQQCFQMLDPLAAMVEQDATPFVGPWHAVQPGSVLQLTLTLSALTGTLAVHLETARTKGAPSRVLGVFQTSYAQATAELMVVTDALVRVVATPGTAPGQLASWNVSGKGFVPFAPAT